MLAVLAILAGLDGEVVATTARWSGSEIVTEAIVEDPAGTRTTLVQLGGAVDGIGMVFTHQPALVRVGDRLRDGTVVAPAARLAPATGGTARYGVQRTTKSRRPLWRDASCIGVTYDAASISAVEAAVLDDAFARWTDAVAGCGRFHAVTERAAVVVARDGENTVAIRRDRWCRPATATEPELCYAPTASAVTRLVFVDDRNAPDDGRILEADIELDAVHFELLAPGAAASTTLPAVDLASVATHEVGHLLGLAHNCGRLDEPWPSDLAGELVPSCDSTDPAVRDGTMYFAIDPGDTRARTPEAGDTAGACALAAELVCEATLEGGCHTGTGAGGLGGLAVGVLALARNVARRRRDRL